MQGGLAAYLRDKYGIPEEEEEGGEEQQDRPSTASYSAFTQEADLYMEERPRARPKTGGCGDRNSADRLSRNRAAKRAVTDVTMYNHVSTLYHMNRRIQEMYQKSKSGRRGYSPPGGVGTVDVAEVVHGGSRGGYQGQDYWSWPVTAIPGYGSRPGTSGGTPRMPGAPRSPPSPHRPTSAPSPGQQNLLFPAAGGRQECHVYQHQRPATILAAFAAGGSPVRDAAPPAPSFTERRVKNTAQALKTAILNEITENRIYEEKRLKQLFRSYLKLNSGEVFYPTLVRVVAELKQELDVM